MDEHCANCRFFQPDDPDKTADLREGEASRGDCRHWSPPAPGCWPRVSSDAWCGDFEQAPDKVKVSEEAFVPIGSDPRIEVLDAGLSALSSRFDELDKKVQGFADRVNLRINSVLKVCALERVEHEDEVRELAEALEERD